MDKNSSEKLISSLLQKWYNANKRSLPWRETGNAYWIWISEVILQQTRVNQGYDYFLRFVERFPDVYSLAQAPEDDVLKLWQGLGYYSRARNLHAAAKQIVEKFKGQFPTSYADILSLKGVGDYTAAAISSIAFHLPFAVVDGNVYRVLSRLFAIDAPIDTSEGKKMFADTAQLILDHENPGNHNQAIMELGALICTPKQPKCGECPLQQICLAFETKRTADFPVKKGKTVQKERFFNYFHIVHNGHTYIKKRDGSDVWKNLYEFPLIETPKQTDLISLQTNPQFLKLFPPCDSFVFEHKLRLNHVLTHRIIRADFYKVEIEPQNSFAESKNFIKTDSDALFKYPVSRLIHKYLETI